MADELVAASPYPLTRCLGSPSAAAVSASTIPMKRSSSVLRGQLASGALRSVMNMLKRWEAGKLSVRTLQLARRSMTATFQMIFPMSGAALTGQNPMAAGCFKKGQSQTPRAGFEPGSPPTPLQFSGRQRSSPWGPWPPLMRPSPRSSGKGLPPCHN